MRKVLSIAAGLVLVMGAAASLAPAEASCPAARLVASAASAGSTYIFTPGNPFTPSAVLQQRPYGGTVSYYANGEFWAVGAGNPAVGVGVDSGSFKGGGNAPGGGTTNWFNIGFYYNDPNYPNFGDAFLDGASGHWNSSGVDGCVTTTGNDPLLQDPGECNAVLIQDADGTATDRAFFAVLANEPDGGGDFLYIPTTGFPNPLNLVPIPKPTIVTTSRVAPDDVQVTVNVCPPFNPSGGYYLSCTPSQNSAIGNLGGGYRVYVRRLGRDLPKPVQWDSRWINQAQHPSPAPPVGSAVWTEVTPVASLIGVQLCQPFTFTFNCNASNEDLYLGTALTFGGVGAGSFNYQTKIVSENTTKIHCGTNLAEPKPLERPGRQIKPAGEDRPKPRR